jgi:hypothetical protein
LDTVRIGEVEASRFILGSNPFSGFSHQGREMDAQMVHHYTCARIKEVLRQAEEAGITTIIARADHHMLRVLLEFWDEGGSLQWFAQTCPELGPPEPSMSRAARAGAVAVHIHGGYADHLLANGRIEELRPAVEHGRSLGLTVGLAGHNPETIRWAEANLDLDFYMCSYYNPIPRDREARHRPGTRERYRAEDRAAMTGLIGTLSRPAVHYKVMAAGRNDPEEALDCVARNLRPGDAVCVGIFNRDEPDMLRRDVAILGAALARHGK